MGRKISNEVRERMIQMVFEDGLKVSQACNVLGLSTTSGYNICKKYRESFGELPEATKPSSSSTKDKGKDNDRGKKSSKQEKSTNRPVVFNSEEGRRVLWKFIKKFPNATISELGDYLAIVFNCKKPCESTIQKMKQKAGIRAVRYWAPNYKAGQGLNYVVEHHRH